VDASVVLVDAVAQEILPFSAHVAVRFAFLTLDTAAV